MKYNQVKILSLSVLLTVFSSMGLAQQQQGSSVGKVPAKVDQKEVKDVGAAASVKDGTAVTQESVTKVSADDEEKNKKFILESAIEYSQKISVDELGEREAGTDFTIAMGYKLSPLASIKAKGVITKQNSGPKDTTYSNTQISLGIKGKELTEELKTLHSLAVVVPTSQESIERDRLKGGVSLTNGLKFENPYVTVTYLLAIAKNIHEYTFNAEGDANIEYNVANSLEVAIPVTDKFSVVVAGLLKNGRTYGGFQRSSFGLSGDLNYDIRKDLTVNLGTTNEGSALRANGVDSNISAYDANTSVYRAGLTYIY